MPTLLGLCHVTVPPMVEGIDYSDYMRGKPDPSDGAALIYCVAPFSDWAHRYGGREFRGIRTERFTYVRGLDGPWLLFDNEKDPLQMTNLANQPAGAQLQEELDKKLQTKLRQTHDEFLPSGAYIKQWRWPADTNGNIPYTN